jgi:hypothetical protein
VVPGFRIILGLNLAVVGRVGLQIQDDHLWMVLSR